MFYVVCPKKAMKRNTGLLKKQNTAPRLTSTPPPPPTVVDENGVGIVPNARVVYSYDPRYYDPHYVDWSGWCFYIFFLLFFLFIVAAFLIVWFVPYPYASGSSRMPVTSAVQTNGGHDIPGLGSVATHNSITGSSDIRTDCTESEQYNLTTHYCEPRIIIPVNVDTELFDRSVNQCDSFFRHTCGSWITHHEAQLARGHVRRVDRAFGAAQHHNQWALRHLITNDGGGGTPIGNFYYSCVDAFVTGDQNAQMTLYRRHVLTQTVEALQTMADLPVVFARLTRLGFTAPVSLGIEEHPKAPQMVPFFGNDGFTSMTEDSVRLIFQRGNVNNEDVARKKARQFMALNTLIEQHRPNDDAIIGSTMAQYVSYLAGPQFTRDMMYVNDVRQHMRITFDMDNWLRELGMTSFPDYHLAWVRDNAYYMWFFGNFGPLKRPSRLAQWRAYVEFSVLYHTTDYFPHLPQTVFVHTSAAAENPKDEQWERRGMRSMKRGVPRVTHEDCMRLTEHMLPGYVSQAYDELTGISQTMRERLLEMFENLRRRLRVMISETVYMTSNDRRWTIHKLDAIIVRIGKPHNWHVEPFGHRLTINDYLKNMDYVRRYRVQRQYDRWNVNDDSAHRLNRDDEQRFGSPLSLVNAMYSPVSNTITIYGGILQYPFIHENYDDTTLYATIGTVVSHEMMHSLDPKGRLFDSQGSFRWGARMGYWQRPTVSEYDKQVMCLVREFGSAHNVQNDLAQHCPALQGQHDDIYGQHTITEDFPDAVGVRLAYETYFLNTTLCTSCASHAVDVQHQARAMWMYSFAQQWCSVATPEYECALATHDVHAEPRIRVDSTLRQVPYFQDIFQCPSNTYMYNTRQNTCNVFGKKL